MKDFGKTDRRDSGNDRNDESRGEMNICSECKFAKKRYWIFGEMLCKNKERNDGKIQTCSDARLGYINSHERVIHYHIRHCPYWEAK